jgi:putative peptide zinc metalloprotease protein
MLNDQTFEFSQARLRLKDSLRFSMRQNAASASYLVEDEVTGRFFRIGMPQYTFLSMLNGKRTVSTALMKTATLLREHAIDESEAANFCKWAIESGLVESETGNSAARRLEQHEQQQKQKVVSYLNPMMMRMPLFNPDPIVSAISRFTNFLVNPLGALIWLMVVVYGFFQLLSNWDSFYTNRVNSFGAQDFIWIAVTWIVLKLVHELAHSLVCKKFGGRVHSCGILLLLLIPMPYVDVTSSWRFDNKWKRILTSAAGMLSEIFIAAVACYVWSVSPPGPLQYHAGNVIITATLHTLLFNINPLMRFDGYYMLSDWLEIPNLATSGRQWLKSVFKRAYFGNKSQPVKETGFRGLAVKGYGVLAMMWFFVIAVGLSLAASSLIEGFGLVVAVVGCIMWAGIPLFKLCKYFLVGTKTEKPNRIWFVGAITTTVLLLGCFFYVCPSPSVVSAPIVIEYEPLSIVRSNGSGFANTIHVADGQLVQPGELLVTLENPELRHELKSLLIDISISELRLNTLFNSGEIDQYQLEGASLAALEKKRIELEAKIDDLIIVAPQAGQILALELDTMEGQYFQPGTELLSIGQPGNIQAIALTKQSDVEWLTANAASEVELLIWGRHEKSLVHGKVSDINPRARDDLPHESFSASIGGPLAVVPRSQVEGNKRSTDEQDLMLIQPRVQIEIALSEEDRASLLPGQTGQLIVRSRSQNMGEYVAVNLIRFVRENNFRTHGL